MKSEMFNLQIEIVMSLKLIIFYALYTVTKFSEFISFEQMSGKKSVAKKQEC